MTHAQAFVSVVVPTFNRHDALARCLASLANQEFPPSRTEVVIVNDGGTSIPPDIAQHARDRLAVSVIDTPHGGPAAARNAGVALCRGDIVAFIDDDCVADCAWLRGLVARLGQHPQAAVGGRVVNALPDNRYARASHHLISFLYRYYHEARCGALPFFTTNNLAVGMDTFARVGEFDSTFPFASEDRDWCDRFLGMGGSLVYAPEAVVRHAHPLTWSSFLHQHFRYGLGARLFHRNRARRRKTGVRLEQGGFYSGMLRTPFTEADPEPFQIAALLVMSQTVGAIGWGVAMLKEVRRRRPR